MSHATWAFGTQLLKDGVPICELTNIDGLAVTSDEIDVTSHCSPGGYEEVIQSIRRTGSVSLEGNFYPGDPGQAALMADYLTGVIGNYKIKFPATMACEWSFQAFVKSAPSTSAPVDGQVPFSAELRVTGQPSLDLGITPNLTNLAVTTGSIVPTFAGDTYSYTATIAANQTTVKITPTGAASGVITVDGVAVGTGEASGNITLGDAGSTTICTVVAKATNKIAIVYTIYLHRLAS